MKPLSPDDPWYTATFEGAARAIELDWDQMPEEEKRAARQEHKRIAVSLARSRGRDLSHILTAPEPATDEARRLGCTCPEPRKGQLLHMLPDCPVHQSRPLRAGQKD